MLKMELQDLILSGLQKTLKLHKILNKLNRVVRNTSFSIGK